MIAPALLTAIIGAYGFIIPIYNEKDLQGIRGCLNCSYVLRTNISLTNEWVPVGNSTAQFTGSFNGQGHTITFAGIAIQNDAGAGFFGYLRSATVFDLRLVGTGNELTVINVEDLNFGLLAGVAKSVLVYGCSCIMVSSFKVSKLFFSHGGLFGSLSNSTIASCFASVTMSFDSVMSLVSGGIAGYSTANLLDKCECQISYSVRNNTQLTLGGVAGLAHATVINGFIVSGTVFSIKTLSKEYIGGMLGHVVGNTTNSSIAVSTVNISIRSEMALESFLGGIVGSSNTSLSILYSNVSVGIYTHAQEASVGGLCGHSSGPEFEATMCLVNADIWTINKDTDYPIMRVGGLIGNFDCNAVIIKDSVGIFSIFVVADVFSIGGLVGIGTNIQAIRCGLSGSITASAAHIEASCAGGIAGSIDNSVLKDCHFIGNLSLFGISTVLAGGIAGHAITSTFHSMYTLTNISVAALDAVAGAFGGVMQSKIAEVYASLNVSANATKAVTVGGLVGLIETVETINSCFVMGTLAAFGSTNNGSIGGLIGTAVCSAGIVTISECYAWGLVAMNITGKGESAIGGLVGNILNSVSVVHCIAYVNISATTAIANVGLFAGTAMEVTPLGMSSSNGGSVDHSLMYVAPTEVLTQVKFIDFQTNFIVLESYCAAFPGTVGCIALGALNTLDFLTKFGPNYFLLNSSLANGSIALSSLPIPTSGTPPWSPRLVLPRSGTASFWSRARWIADKKFLRGFPFHKSINYTSYCGLHADCHGAGLSPVDAVCLPGWISRTANSSVTLGSMDHCNVFICSSDSECNNKGICSGTLCMCALGYTGIDCSVSICTEINEDSCGPDTCRRFSATSATGTCVCVSTEFFSQLGACLYGCRPIAHGVCQADDTIACFKDYINTSGCFSYDCTGATDNICNNKGQCVEGRCNCAPNSMSLASNCYDVCSVSPTPECITLDCGQDNACSSRGICVPSLVSNIATCICNVDQFSLPTGTHYGGPLCTDCEIGYINYQGTCLQDRCLRCVGGECTHNALLHAIVCLCPERRVLQNGVCVADFCTNCSTGLCLPIPYSRLSNDRYCICSADRDVTPCFTLNCRGCLNGFCEPNATTMTIECVCPKGLMHNVTSGICVLVSWSNQTLVIVLGVIFIGVEMIAVIVLCAVFIKKCIARHHRAMGPTPLLPAQMELS